MELEQAIECLKKLREAPDLKSSEKVAASFPRRLKKQELQTINCNDFRRDTKGR